MTLHETISQFGSSRLSWSGSSLASSSRSRLRCGWASTRRLSDQTPWAGPLAKRSATSLGASTGLQPSGKSSANLYSRWTQRLDGLVQQVGAGVGRRERGRGDQGVERRPGRGVAGVLDVEDEGVELAVGDDPDRHLAPEAARVGMELPDRLEPLAAPILDQPVDGQLAAGPAVIPGVGVDPGAILVQALGRQGQLAGRDARPVGSSCGMNATKTRSSFSRTASGQSLGIRVVTPYLGASNGSVGGRLANARQKP